MADITTNLIHYWTFDEASSPWTDSIGGIVATQNTAVTGNIPAPIGTGIDFDGSNDLDLDSSISFAIAADFTYAAWLNLDVLGTYVVIAADANADNYWQVSETFVRMRLNALSSAMTLDVSLVADRFYHVAVTRISDLLITYIDGVAQSDTEVNTNAVVAMDKIGSHNSGAADFNGFMDELRIYSRGLSAVEVAALAAFPAGSKRPQSLANQTPFNPFGF